MKKAKTVVQFTALVCAVVLTCTLLYFPSQALIKNVRTVSGDQDVTMTEPEITANEITYCDVQFESVAAAEKYFGYKYEIREWHQPFYHYATGTKDIFRYNYYFFHGDDDATFISVKN